MPNPKEWLDDEFSNYHQLKIDEKHTEYLHVQRDQWSKEVYKSERKTNIGCFLAVILFPVMMIVLGNFGMGEWILWIIALGVFLKVRNAKRGNNLVIHGAYRYELGLDKIVRYSTHDYDIFYFKDILQIQDHSFGLVIRKKIRLIDRIGLDLFRFTNKSLMILPNQLYAFEQSKAFLLERVNTSKNGAS